MSVPAENVKQLTGMPSKLGLAQAYIRGRIFHRRRISTQEGQIWLTVLRMPARDEFSHPITVEVRSRGTLGQKDEDWSGVVEIAGFPRAFDSKPDPHTGEVTRVHTAQLQLNVVDS